MVRRKVFYFLLLTAVIAWGNGAWAGPEQYTKTMENYVIPDVTLVNQDGKKVRLQSLLLSGKPVMVDFVYTTCTTICPVLSANFTNFQRKLGADTSKVQLVSVSIDPENDNPKAMKAYLKRYYAKPGWDFVSGTRGEIDKALKALGAFQVNKMNHEPVVILKTPSKNQWVRIYGLIGTSDLMKEYERAQK